MNLGSLKLENNLILAPMQKIKSKRLKELVNELYEKQEADKRN